MKKIIFVFCFTSSGILYAQNNIGVQNDLKTVALHNLNVNTTAISTFSNATVKGTQYLFNAWMPGSVTDENNVTYSKNYSFNLDKINHDLYALYNTQGNMSVLLDKSKIKHFTIGDLNFINSALINQRAGLFYQVLVDDR